MVLFHDKRDQSHLPKSEDYDIPLTKTSLVVANKRFRQTGAPRVVGNDKEKAARIVSSVTKDRRKGIINPGNTVGEYLEFLNGIAAGD